MDERIKMGNRYNKMKFPKQYKDENSHDNIKMKFKNKNKIRVNDEEDIAIHQSWRRPIMKCIRVRSMHSYEYEHYSYEQYSLLRSTLRTILKPSTSTSAGPRPVTAIFPSLQ